METIESIIQELEQRWSDALNFSVVQLIDFGPAHFNPNENIISVPRNLEPDLAIKLEANASRLRVTLEVTLLHEFAHFEDFNTNGQAESGDTHRLQWRQALRTLATKMHKEALITRTVCQACFQDTVAHGASLSITEVQLERECEQSSCDTCE